MASPNWDQEKLLLKLGITELNEMQKETQRAILAYKEVVLLSPTGTGKTLAFLLPILENLDARIDVIQALILVPSRELAIQIEQVLREMGTGYKVNAVYGGRAGYKDRSELKQAPSILIGTPGRVADHLRRGILDLDEVETLVLDEFDKSLETGFEKEMKEIVINLPSLKKKVLTSATQQVEIPEFVNISNPKRLDFLVDEAPNLQLRKVISPTKDRLRTTVNLLLGLGDKNGILFCNLKESVQGVSDYLKRNRISHACFYGGMDQMDRERSLIKFRNGTVRLLVATDLASRGLDIPEMDYIIHYELPFKFEQFVHRNGRTARMHQQGAAYLIFGPNDYMPDFVQEAEAYALGKKEVKAKTRWKTLYISGGRKDKISKGDIAGLLFKQGGLSKEEVGIIELKQDCAYVAIRDKKINQIAKELNNSRLKKRKVRISVLE